MIFFFILLFDFVGAVLLSFLHTSFAFHNGSGRIEIYIYFIYVCSSWYSRARNTFSIYLFWFDFLSAYISFHSNIFISIVFFPILFRRFRRERCVFTFGYALLHIIYLCRFSIIFFDRLFTKSFFGPGVVLHKNFIYMLVAKNKQQPKKNRYNDRNSTENKSENRRSTLGIRKKNYTLHGLHE